MAQPVTTDCESLASRPSNYFLATTFRSGDNDDDPTSDAELFLAIPSEGDPIPGQYSWGSYANGGEEKISTGSAMVPVLLSLASDGTSTDIVWQVGSKQLLYTAERTWNISSVVVKGYVADAANYTLKIQDFVIGTTGLDASCNLSFGPGFRNKMTDCRRYTLPNSTTSIEIRANIALDGPLLVDDGVPTNIHLLVDAIKGNFFLYE
jgi:hypothetical protein